MEKDYQPQFEECFSSSNDIYSKSDYVTEGKASHQPKHYDTTRELKKCSNCGYSLIEDQIFCPKCGQKADVCINKNNLDSINKFNQDIKQKKTCAETKDAILFTCISFLSGIFLFAKGYYKQRLLVKTDSNSSVFYYLKSYNTLLTSIEDYLIIIPIVVCILLLALCVFSWQKNNPKSSEACTVLSATSFGLVLISSIICSKKFRWTPPGSVSFCTSFESYSFLFVIELILLGSLLVFSILKHKNITIFKSK